ncbi:hypothetical protein [Microbacterium lacus]|uniref:hypothetical protein n=1 Tax=Microbacterium lacus TaxID=415217 RepID=UPI0018E212F0|nr:hypothetical protein [Microbacterium lacus]
MSANESRPEAAIEDPAGELIYHQNRPHPALPTDTRRKPIALDTGTSSDAAVKLSSTTRAAVMKAIISILRERAATDDEIAAEYAMRGGPSYPIVTPQRLRTARAALVHEGLVRDSGALAFSTLGNRATLWEVSR